jgi:hypothetical protein
VGPDTCHPGNDEGYQETFEYAVAFNAASADVYVKGELFAGGTLTGCNLTYQTVVIGEDINGRELKWQLTGQAVIDGGDDSCVESEFDWDGTETFEIVASTDDAVEPGCTYPMSSFGTIVSGS